MTNDIPMGAIVSQCIAGMLIILKQTKVVKSRLLKPQGLTARTRAKFNRCQHTNPLCILLA